MPKQTTKREPAKIRADVLGAIRSHCNNSSPKLEQQSTIDDLLIMAVRIRRWPEITMIDGEVDEQTSTH